MRRSINVGVALLGLLVVAAITVAAGSGRKPVAEKAATSVRMLTEAEVAQIGKRFPGLGVRSQVRSMLLDCLFPNAATYKALRPGGTPRIPYMITISGSKAFEVPSDFNLLLREQGIRVTDDNIIDLAKAFVMLAVGSEPIVDTMTGEYVGIGSIPQVVFLEAQRIEQRDSSDPNPIDAKIACRVGSEVQTWEFYERRHLLSRGRWIKAGQFGVVRKIINGRPAREYVPVHAEEETRRGAVLSDPEVEVVDTAGYATVERESTKQGIYYHYYLKTHRNGAPTNQWGKTGTLPYLLT